VVDSEVVVDVVVDEVVVAVVVTLGRVSPPLVVIGVPAPVSVAVVPVGGCLAVSVAARVSSDGVPLHAAQIAIPARAVRTLVIDIKDSPDGSKSNRRARLARTVKQIDGGQ
jgi:anti-sigma factor RsiW